jgi:hypothetical protein
MTIDLSKPLSELIVEIATNPRTAAQQMVVMRKELAEVRAELAAVKEAIKTVLVAEANNDGWGPDVTHLATLKNAIVTPSSADKVLAVLEAADIAEDLALNAPELNMEHHNIDAHQISALNDAMCEIYKVLEPVRALREKG